MTWRDGSFSKPLYMHQVSEGMLRFVWLATLLQSPGLTALTLLDEPEVSLHPELLNLLAGLMREAANRTQIVVATHSESLIMFLKPSEIVVMDVAEDGTANLQWADKMKLDQWLDEYTLDELWRNGRLGAAIPTLITLLRSLARGRDITQKPAMRSESWKERSERCCCGLSRTASLAEQDSYAVRWRSDLDCSSAQPPVHPEESCR
jgi:energy-coupling factor transporter ATP-binding protein EcfA2